MKKSITSSLGLIVTIAAILLSSCGTNTTFKKRYHNRGFQFDWGNSISQVHPKSKSDGTSHRSKKSTLQKQSETPINDEIASSPSVLVNTVDIHPDIALINDKIANREVAKKPTAVWQKTISVVKDTNSNPISVNNSARSAEAKNDQVDRIYGKLAFVFGVLSLLGVLFIGRLSFIFAIAAIALGIIGLNSDSRSMAIIGLVLGSLYFLILILAVIALLVIFL
jgi:hypothetical protein